MEETFEHIIALIEKTRATYIISSETKHPLVVMDLETYQNLVASIKPLPLQERTEQVALPVVVPKKPNQIESLDVSVALPAQEPRASAQPKLIREDLARRMATTYHMAPRIKKIKKKEVEPVKKNSGEHDIQPEHPAAQKQPMIHASQAPEVQAILDERDAEFSPAPQA